jgi:hypothetical protein
MWLDVSELIDPRRERGPVGRCMRREATEPAGEDGEVLSADSSAASAPGNADGGTGATDFFRGRSGSWRPSSGSGEADADRGAVAGGAGSRCREGGGDGCGSERRGGDVAEAEDARAGASSCMRRKPDGTASVAEADVERREPAHGCEASGEGEGTPSTGSATPAMYRSSGVPCTSTWSGSSKSATSTTLESGAECRPREGPGRGTTTADEAIAGVCSSV